MVIGEATEVKDLNEKRRGLDVVVEHIIPGRSRDAGRRRRRSCLPACSCARLTESSAKVRTGGQPTRTRTMTSSVWAGVVPFTHRVDGTDRSTRPGALTPIPGLRRAYRVGRRRDAPS